MANFPQQHALCSEMPALLLGRQQSPEALQLFRSTPENSPLTAAGHSHQDPQDQDDKSNMAASNI